MARGLSSSLFFLNATDVTEAQIRGASFFFCLFPVRSRDAVKREKLPQSEREAKKRCPSGSVGKHISPLFFFFPVSCFCYLADNGRLTDCAVGKVFRAGFP